jgi:CRP/FNR family transcriptional activator FtrB
VKPAQFVRRKETQKRAMIIRQNDADRVRSIRLFRSLSAQRLESLLKSASLRYVARRTVLFREGRRPTILYTLIEGSVELFSVHHQRRCTIGVVRRELIDTHPGFASAAAYELANDHHEAVEDLKDLRLRATIERLAQWMLRSDMMAGGTGSFAIPYNKRTLASYLGMAPENLSRNLSALASDGLVVRGRRVTLNNRPALAAKAGLSLGAVHMG